MSLHCGAVQFRYIFLWPIIPEKILNTDTIFGVKGAALHKLNGGENVIYHRLNNISERKKNHPKLTAETRNKYSCRGYF